MVSEGFVFKLIVVICVLVIAVIIAVRLDKKLLARVVSDLFGVLKEYLGMVKDFYRNPR